MIGEVRRLLFFDVMSALGTRRWLAVPPALFVAGYFGADRAQYDPDASTPLLLNWWDGPLSMMTDSSIVVFAFGLGFTFVVGDLYVRDCSSGTAAMTLIRTRSRTNWWVAKIMSLGVLALVYSILGFGSALAASAVQLPLSLTTSHAARTAWGAPESLYPRFEGMPTAGFFLLVILYTAFALWAVGAIVLGVSAVYPRPVVPLTTALLWVTLGSPLVAPLYLREGLGTLDPLYRISYAVHFEATGFSATRWFTSFVVISVALVLATLLGSWKLRQADL